MSKRASDERDSYLTLDGGRGSGVAGRVGRRQLHITYNQNTKTLQTIRGNGRNTATNYELRTQTVSIYISQFTSFHSSIRHNFDPKYASDKSGEHIIRKRM